MKSDPKFQDPIKIKTQRPKDTPKDGVPPWDFKAPHYDQRSGPYVQAGVNYGVGHKQPVGHKGDPKSRVSTLPYGRDVPTMEVDETK